MVLLRILLVGVLAGSGLACHRVALVEASHGPEPATLPPPFHIVRNAHNVETSESDEYGTRLEYSVKAVPRELLDDLLGHVPGDWEAVRKPGLFGWQSGVNLVRGKPMSQSIFSAAFRAQSGDLFLLSVAHDAQSPRDMPAEVGVLMVRYAANAVPEVLTDGRGAALGQRPSPSETDS